MVGISSSHHKFSFSAIVVIGGLQAVRAFPTTTTRTALRSPSSLSHRTLRSRRTRSGGKSSWLPSWPEDPRPSSSLESQITASPSVDVFRNDTDAFIMESFLSAAAPTTNELVLVDVETALADIEARQQAGTSIDIEVPDLEEVAHHDVVVTPPTITTTEETVKPIEEKAAVAVDDDDVPTYSRLIKFAATSILIWLSEPLLSLVDTSVVGLSQSNAVLQLASMGPATTLMDSCIYMTYFLAIATTNQIALQLQSNDQGPSKFRQLQRTTSHVLCTAFLLGSAVTATVFMAGPGLLAKMAGGSASPELIRYAVGYSRIRAVVAPFAVMGMVSQSFLLATMNTRTVAMSVLAASSINCIGDWLLRSHGVYGAAAATALAGVSSAMILLRAVKRQMSSWRKQELEATNMSSEVETVSSSPFSSLIKPKVPFLSLPDFKSLSDLIKLSLPLAFNMWSKIVSYSALTLSATNCGVVSLAAHNIMLRVFWLCGCASDCIGQTAQSFLPRTLYPKFVLSKFKAVWNKLFVLGAGAATIGTLVGAGLFSFGTGLLARDTAIMHALKHNHFFLGLSLILYPFIVLQEGTIIAARDFKNLVCTYVVTLAVHFTVLGNFASTLTGVWRAMFIWQISRLINYNLWKKRRGRNENSDRQECITRDAQSSSQQPAFCA